MSFPGEVTVRRGREGPLAKFTIAHHADDAGFRYEAALFDMPEPLDEAKQAALRRAVVRGLAAGPEVIRTRTESVTIAGASVPLVRLDLTGDRAGLWWVFYPEPCRMLQLSVVGPAADLEQRGRAFFQTYRRDAAEHCVPGSSGTGPAQPNRSEP